MKFFKYVFLGFAFLFGLPSISHAVLVTPQQSVVFSFDTSSLGDLSLGGFRYATDPCFNEECLWDSESSFDMLFGTSLGNDDLGTDRRTNLFDFDVHNLSGPLGPQFIPASVSTLFISLRYVDDVFEADELVVSYLDPSLPSPQSLIGEFAGVSVIPVPGAVWLFGTAIIGLIGFKRRCKVA